MAAAKVFDAVRARDVDRLRALIAATPNAISFRDEEERTPLIVAAFEGATACVEFLVAAGSDAYAEDVGGRDAVQWAAAEGHVAALAHLLSKNRAQVDSCTKAGNTPLHRAAAYGHVRAARVLIDAGADIDCVSDDGSSPLLRAARWGHADVVALLLSVGAATGTPDNAGRTALEWAERKGFVDAAALLRAAGAEGGGGEAPVSARASRSTTPTQLGAAPAAPGPGAASRDARGAAHVGGGGGGGIRMPRHASSGGVGEAGDEELRVLAAAGVDDRGGDGGEGADGAGAGGDEYDDGGGADGDGAQAGTALASAQVLPIRVEGWMAKQGHIFRTWKNRWFVLEGRNMFYFAKEGAPKARGVIRMVDGTDVIVEERYAKPFCFTVVTPTKRFVLQAADEDEMAEWLEAVHNNLECMPYEDGQADGGLTGDDD